MNNFFTADELLDRPALSGHTLSAMHIAKRQYWIFETNIPRKGIAWPQSQFPHSCVCERFLYFYGWSAYSAAGKYVDRSSEYMYKRSLTHECECAIPFLGTHYWDLICSVRDQWFGRLRGHFCNGRFRRKVFHSSDLRPYIYNCTVMCVYRKECDDVSTCPVHMSVSLLPS